MDSYVPFLKFKSNEVGALKELSSTVREAISPFFDIPKKPNMTSDALRKSISSSRRKYDLHLSWCVNFYVDNYDIDDDLKIDDEQNYKYIINCFSDTFFIPVVGIDRADERNEVVFKEKREGGILSGAVALRVTREEIEDYSLCRDDIAELLAKAFDEFEHVHLIVDNRVVLKSEVSSRSCQVVDFFKMVNGEFLFEKKIVAGSSITPSIRDLAEPCSEESVKRTEVSIFRFLQKKCGANCAVFGDYTTVSPEYSDVEVRSEIIRRITAPKIIYPYDDFQFLLRGGSLESHPRGNKQYNDLCKVLFHKPFFRKKSSFGERFVEEKSNFIGSQVTPSTIPKPLINAHIEFMVGNFAF